MDLCVMNPPFVRSVGGNLLFGSLPDERGILQAELKRRVKQIGANATAGLGSVFVALADKWLKVGGRLAFVVPAAIASGEAWADTRQLISDRYHLETVVSSQDAERQNFSENTDISEVLFIARRRKETEPPGRTVYINLSRNPRSIHEAIDLANRIVHVRDPVGIEDEGLSSISGPGGRLGEMLTLPQASDEQNWYAALFAQTELIRIFRILEQGALRVPGRDQIIPLPLCRLDSIGDLGPDRKRISEGFQVTEDDWTPYPGFWGHISSRDLTIRQEPNVQLTAWLESPRGPKYGAHLWERAGRILLVERIRLNTHRLLAIRFEKEVLGNVWWALKPQGLNDRQEKALVLWLNSTLSVLLVFGRRVVTQGAWTQMKQPAWQSMPVLDVRTLSPKSLAILASTYDVLSSRPMESLSQLKLDLVRCEIDSAIGHALGISEFSFLRDLLDREPGLTARGIPVQHHNNDTDHEADFELF
jgi:hypothetical protein